MLTTRRTVTYVFDFFSDVIQQAIVPEITVMISRITGIKMQLNLIGGYNVLQGLTTRMMNNL